jgi:sec-independent protein translocase protein TatA
MGIGSISVPQLLIILLLVVLLFGSKRLGSLGSDLGSAIKGFKKAINDEKKDDIEESDTAAVKQEQKQDHSKS